MSAPIRTRLAVSGDEFKANADAMGLLPPPASLVT